MTTELADDVPSSRALAQRVRRHLQLVARRGQPITYKALADALALTPPHTIHRVTQALECLMREDAAHGRPFLAAFVISRSGGGLPAPGFFQISRELGRFGGELSGPEASAYYDAALAAAIDFWGTAEATEWGDAP